MQEDTRLAMGESAADTSPFAPYAREREQLRYRANMIFRANMGQCLLWSLCLILLFLMAEYLPIAAMGQDIFLLQVAAQYAPYLLVPLLFYGLYGWMQRIVLGEDKAICGFAAPFRWMGEMPLRRNAALVLGLAAIYWGGSVLIKNILQIISNQLYSLMQTGAKWLTGTDVSIAAFGQILLYDIPVFLMTMILLGFFLTHAVYERGRRAFGLVSFRGMLGKTLRAEAGLMAKYLLLPYVLFFLILPFLQTAPQFLDDKLFALVMTYTYLPFGLVYYPLSAITRFLIVMRQPEVALGGPDTAGYDFSRTDMAYQEKHSRQGEAV